MNTKQALDEQYKVLKQIETKICCLITAIEDGGGTGTVTHTAGALTLNSLVLGAGAADTKVVAGIISDGISVLTLGVAGGAVGGVAFKNATSGTITLIPTTGALGTVTLSLPAITDTLVAKTTTDTLTNKRITQRVNSATSTATLTPNIDSYDLEILTAQAASLTIAAPTGTPTNGQALLIRIKDNGSAQTLTFNAIYRAFGSALPGSTNISKTLYIGAIYNSTDNKYDTFPSTEEI